MLNDLRLYVDIRVARILLIGFISGFPWVLIGSILTPWLKDFGLTRTTIAFAGGITAVYAFNFLWAPLIDRIRIPVLSNRLGDRKAWTFCMQCVILLSILIWSGLNPAADLTFIVFIGLVIAIASATQDITIDALRIEQVNRDDAKMMAVGAAAAVVGWWTGFKLGGAIALWAAHLFEVAGHENYWRSTILSMGCIVILCNILLLQVRERPVDARKQQQSNTTKDYTDKLETSGIRGTYAKVMSWLATAVVEPLLSFFKRNGFAIAIALLAFIFLFKIGEAFLGRVSLLFYLEIGFDKQQIAIYSKGLGWVITVTCTILGSYIAVKRGVVKTLVVAGLAMAATNLLFSLLAWIGPSESLFAIAVIADDITSAFSSIAFVAFISMLVDRTYTASQYALLASIGTAGRNLFAAGSGWAVDALDGDWGTFFVITALMVLPSLFCLWTLRHRIVAIIGLRAQEAIDSSEGDQDRSNKTMDDAAA